MGFLWNGSVPIWRIMGAYPRWPCHAFLPSQWVITISLITLTSRIVEVIYASIGALIFSLYIIFDTYSICNLLHPDEYIVGAVNLYAKYYVKWLTIGISTSSISS
jgi:hypothetical protein